MDTFIVSARKYRPQNFNTVVGQEHITTTLKNAIQHNQLAHAFLFCGPRGVGKTTCARILAKTINCEKRTKDGEACNKCTSCVSFDNGTSFNIHELDAASNNSVEDIRTLTEQVRFAPQAGKYKVYIVDEVHMLSSSAFNAFLKTLEEPPPFVIFILATTEKHKILPTILSRCQIFDFKRITLADTTGHLKEICKKEGVKAEDAALHLIAQKSEGCMRDALSIMDKIVSFTNGKLTYANTIEHLNILDEEYYFRLISDLQQQKPTEALLLFDEINQKGFEGDVLLEGLLECLRNILVSKDKKAAALLETAEDFKPKYVQAAAQTDPGWLLASLNIVSEAIINFKQARNKRLFIEIILVKLSYLQQAIDLTASGPGVVKKKITDKNSPVAFRNLVPVAVKADPQPAPVEQVAAKLIIEEPKVGNPVKQEIKVETKQPASAGQTVSLGVLSRIREKVTRTDDKSNTGSLPLTEENIEKAWSAFVSKLEERKQHSSVSNFNMAKVTAAGENTLEITVEGEFHRKFIDAERSELVSHLQGFFRNRLLVFNFHVLPETSKDAAEIPLSSREFFNKMAEQYPMLKALKEKLKLEIDI